MPKIYISSTFKDLKDYRRVAIETVDRLGHTTHAMEKYFASDDRPLDMCLADVAQCDLYVGIFAWRYGTIPPERSSDQRSITECEFREAVRLGIPCVMFLSDDKPGKWPSDGDEDYKRIERFRKEVSEDWSFSLFDNPDRLGLEISLAVDGWLNKPDFSRYLTRLAAECAELPDLPNHTKNLSLQDIMRIRVSFPPNENPQDGAKKKETRLVDLPQAVTEERAWVVVGAGGEGKSTALRFLAHHHAKRWLEAWRGRRGGGGRNGQPLIPVLVALCGGRSSLREQVWEALQQPDFRCSRDAVDRWIVTQPFLFLFDRREDVDARSAGVDFIDLMRVASRSRLVVASRASASLAEWPWPQARLEAPTNSRIRSFLRTLLGTEPGEQLFSMLVQNCAVEPFRRPLFARLLALSSPVLLEKKRFTLAQMFRDVLEGRFLRQWERAQDSEVQANMARDFLARTAYEMVVADTYAIDRDAALRQIQSAAKRHGVMTDTLGAESVLESVLRHGVMSVSDRGLQFWHTSFRDYFAAVWLEGHAGALRVYARSWSLGSHESLFLYFGLLSGDLLDRRLQQLLFGLRVTTFSLSVGPGSEPSSRLICVLRCLVQAREGKPTWQRRFLRLLPREFSSFFLSVASPTLYGGHKEYGDSLRYMCDLIGQLGTPEAFEYLQTVKADLEFVAPGLMHHDDVSVIEKLAMALGSDEHAHDDQGRRASRHNREVIGSLFLQSADGRCSAVLKQLLRNGDAASKERILGSLGSAASHLELSDQPELREALSQQWTTLLTALALDDENKGVRGLALAFLKRLGEFVTDRGSLPEPAHAAFINALSDPKRERRRRALDCLDYPALSRHMDIAWRLLDEPDISVVIDVLFHYMLGKSRRVFCRAVMKAVKARDTNADTVGSVAKAIYVHLLENQPGGRVPRRSVAYLMSAAWLGGYDWVRLYAVHALSSLRLEWTAGFLTNVLWRDEWQHTRRAALGGLLGLTEVDARPLLLRALEDNAVEVRGMAAAECWRDKYDDNFRQASGPILFRLLGDESEYVSRYAGYALKKYGYVDKDRHDLEGTLAYLGPTVASGDSDVDVRMRQ